MRYSLPYLVYPWLDYSDGYFRRECPFVIYKDIAPLSEKEPSASFPSEQGLIAEVFVGIMWIVGGLWRWIGLTSGLIVMISRLYVGYHFVSDVLIGALIGLILFLLVRKRHHEKQSIFHEPSERWPNSVM